MTLPVDGAEPVRSGEEIDEAALTAFLQERLPGLRGGPVVRQFRQGHSNLTYLVSVGGRDYVLRRPPFGNQVKSAHDMGREFRILSALAPVFQPAPKPLVLCEDPAVIGAPFYLVERRHGAIIRRTLPPALAEDSKAVDLLCWSLVSTLAALHRIDHRAVGLGDFGKPVGYVARQVKGWTERFEAARTEEVPALDEAARWLAANLPPESGVAVIHNDFKFDNLMISTEEPGRVTAVLDWEMATVGDPLMDLGTALAYWIEPTDPEPIRSVAMVPTMAPGMWSRRRLVETYCELTDRSPIDLRFYHAFGHFKLAVVIQQIYARYSRGDTKDERFATMNRMVAILADEAMTAILRSTS